jgi:transcriptional regulator with XRE-family HTH domain
VEVWEKINYLFEEKKMSKKEFADRLVALNPILKRTSETPSHQTILGYLYGKREIKIELIPYIAEVLGVNEQELFESELEYSANQNIKYSKEVREIISLIPYAPHAFVEQVLDTLRKYKKLLTEHSRI